MNTQKQNFIMNTYFNEKEYLQNKTDAYNAKHPDAHHTVEQTKQEISDNGLTALEDFKQYGAWEKNADGSIGINPSSFFDLDSYYSDKSHKMSQDGIPVTKEKLADKMHTEGLDPLSDYSEYGYKDGLVPRAEDMSAKNFDTKNKIPLSGNEQIDGLLGQTMNWNALGKNNTITFAFAESQEEVVSAKAMGDNHAKGFSKDLHAFTEEQQDATANIFAYLKGITGINFEEKDASEANIIFYRSDLSASHASGMTIFNAFSDKVLLTLDNKNVSQDVSHGEGRQTLLHEIGHAMGLKHPFEGGHSIVDENSDKCVTKSLMAYMHPIDGNHWFYTTESRNYYSPNDIKALGYLYGSDGLNGTEGLVYTPATA